MRKADVFVKNISSVAKVLRHNALQKLEVVPCMPGGFMTVKNSAIVVEPGMVIRLPFGIWQNPPGAWRLNWTKEVSREDFYAALLVEATGIDQTPETTETVEVVEVVAEPVAEAVPKPKPRAKRSSKK